MKPYPWHQVEFQRLLLARQRFPHAVLLHGPAGVGKVQFGLSAAQALLCEAPGASHLPCEQCPACAWFEAGNHPDFRLIAPDAGTEAREGEEGAREDGIRILIDQIRALPDFINVTSHRSGSKVVLIHPAEALNVNAANALLKSLEEPPARTVFILVSHRPHFLLPTVRSRCQQIALPAPDRAAAVEWLDAQDVADASLALAQAGGAPLLAQRFADKEHSQRRDSFLKRMAVQPFDALVLAEEIRDFPVRDVLMWLQKWSFDLILEKFLGRVRYNPDYAAAISSLAGQMEALAALRFHRAVVGLQRVADHPLNARLLYEQLLLDYASLVGASRQQNRMH